MSVEYKVLECGRESLENRLNAYAKDGWRAWRVMPPRLETGRNYVVVFERTLRPQYMRWGSSLGERGDEVPLAEGGDVPKPPPWVSGEDGPMFNPKGWRYP